jgi:beta-barrel assembly-enhancing protease
LRYHPAMRRLTSRSAAALAMAALSGVLAAAQTRIAPPKNNYTPAQDVQLGHDAALEAERQLPVMHDDEVTSYIEGIGQRLVAAIPAALQHPEFRYTFQVVNVREINAFALPGGPMFVNRGMIEAAHAEGEIAGVMAHELSHVVLRHGTAQASRATKYEVGQLAGAVLGAIIGGGVGSVVAQGTQFGIGTAFLRFSREYEKQADLEGSQIMARAGYDPRDMANMFKTIEQQGGSNGPQWLSDHPDPGNRYEYILEEAGRLNVANPIRDTRDFDRVQAHLRQLPRAPTTEEVTREAARTGSAGRPGSADSPPTGRVAPPASRYTTYEEGNTFRVSVPSNWRELHDNQAVTFAPTGAYGTVNGRNVFTHGVEIGIARNESHDLQTATDELVDSFIRSNPGMGRPSRYERISVDGREGIRTTLSNTNEATRQPETIQVVTAAVGHGDLLYALGVAPEGEFKSYRTVFDRVVGSIQLAK